MWFDHSKCNFIPSIHALHTRVIHILVYIYMYIYDTHRFCECLVHVNMNSDSRMMSMMCARWMTDIYYHWCIANCTALFACCYTIISYIYIISSLLSVPWQLEYISKICHMCFIMFVPVWQHFVMNWIVFQHKIPSFLPSPIADVIDVIAVYNIFLYIKWSSIAWFATQHWACQTCPVNCMWTANVNKWIICHVSLTIYRKKKFY